MCRSWLDCVCRWRDATVFDIRAFDFDDEEVARRRPRYRRLLHALIDLAMNDKMSRLRIGFDPETEQPFMQFYGPFYEDEPKWWEMVPPPRVGFYVMLKWCIANSTSLLSPLAGEQAILATRNGHLLSLRFTPIESHAFEIAWD
jgi:hypothetical protein